MDGMNKFTLLGLPILEILSRGHRGLLDRETREVNPSRRFATVFATDMHV